MLKTTLYLPNELKAALSRTARVRGVSEATVVRDALAREVAQIQVRPRGGLFSGGESIADHLDDHLVGFGE